MAEVSDYIEIIGDAFVEVPALNGGAQFALPDFTTKNRNSSHTAFLIYSVRNLTSSAEVFINNFFVGSIDATSGDFWTAQLMSVTGATLNIKDPNEIVIKNASDTFHIKNLICFFHQSS
jgi:hypothetical protein